MTGERAVTILSLESSVSNKVTVCAAYKKCPLWYKAAKAARLDLIGHGKRKSTTTAQLNITPSVQAQTPNSKYIVTNLS